MHNPSTEPILLSTNLGELNKYLGIFQELNTLNSPKNIALENWLQLLNWNFKNRLFPYQKLQKLWTKLIKKYKFKFTEWEVSSNHCNIHSLLLDENGNGLQSLIRFYQERKLIAWKENIFHYGLLNLIYHKQFTNLEMFFLTQVICEEWETNYQQLEVFQAYYREPKYTKTKELYDAFICYQQKSEPGTRLYEYLTAYNPQYNIAAKNTPSFYKELHIQIHNHTK